MRLELKDLSKDYGEVAAVRDISMKIKDGELVVLLGPSGCGKTTTMMMIAGLIRPTAGDILFDGRGVLKVHPKDRHVGMVFQSYALYPHMTVFENMTFALKLRKVPLAARRKKAGKIAEMLHLSELLDRKPGELSGGQQQRVSVGRALIKEPKLLLFDEPLSNLDASLRASLRGEIRRIQKETGITSLYVTHDQAEAMAMADRIAVIMNGALAAFERPEDLHDRPKSKLLAEFVGVPAMNFFDVELKEEGGALYAVADGGKWKLASGRRPRSGGKKVLLGIRPQDIRESASGVRTVVRGVEPLGREKLVTVGVGGREAALYVPTSSCLALGAAATVEFDMARAHFFDPQTGSSLLG